MTMEMTYQLIDQLASAGTTGQTGAKRDAGTQNKSDGSFDTMVRQKQQEAKGTAETAGAGSKAPEEADKTVTDEDRAAMAAAMLMQPQPMIMYVQSENGTEADPGALPKEAALEIAALPEQAAELTALPEQAPEEAAALPEQAAETFELPAQTVTERPAEAAAPGAEQRTEETAQSRLVQTDGAAAEAVPAKAETAERENDGAEFSMDTREGETEALEETPVPEAPVFGYMDASPVKVAFSETVERPVELEAAGAAEELGARIESLLTDEAGDTKLELSLSPASLGKLTVEITRSADGSLHVHLFAATEKAAALLEKNAGGLQSLLAAKDRPQTTVEVRFEEGAQQKFLDPNGQRQNQNGAYQQQQQQQRGHQREALRVEDFMSRLRLGLVDLDAAM